VIVFNAENAATHRCEADKGSQISRAVLTVSGYPFFRETEMEST
jgi:hypothetical protein